MASRNDKLFQKRKALGKAALQRKRHSREKRRRLLIVTEGEVTEPGYFEHLRQFLMLTSVDVDVCGHCDSSPIDVVQYAKKRAEVEGQWEAGGYDQIYCVFDRDAHGSFERAKSFVQDLNKSRKFPAKQIDHICSIPCFEYWLLLHFNYTRAAFVESRGRSPCDMVRIALTDAAKGAQIDKALSKPVLAALMDLRQDAIANAKRAAKDAESTGEPNPSTSVHRVLEELETLKLEIGA